METLLIVVVIVIVLILIVRASGCSRPRGHHRRSRGCRCQRGWRRFW